MRQFDVASASSADTGLDSGINSRYLEFGCDITLFPDFDYTIIGRGEDSYSPYDVFCENRTKSFFPIISTQWAGVGSNVCGWSKQASITGRAYILSSNPSNPSSGGPGENFTLGGLHLIGEPGGGVLTGQLLTGGAVITLTVGDSKGTVCSKQKTITLAPSPLNDPGVLLERRQYMDASDLSAFMLAHWAVTADCILPITSFPYADHWQAGYGGVAVIIQVEGCGAWLGIGPTLGPGIHFQEDANTLYKRRRITDYTIADPTGLYDLVAHIGGAPLPPNLIEVRNV